MFIETLLVGFLLALLWVELTDISPGGIIVPGYLALNLSRPLPVLATFAAALLALAFYRLVSPHFVLFGRRRFVLLVLAGAAAGEALNLISSSLAPSSPALRVIGWIIPGIIAGNLIRQKPLPTLASCLAVSGAVFAVVKLAAALM